uniref:medium-chain acyl-CoA ligase n=1 Tax=Sphenodon punctatus TaxID=8508 RepID=A0A8D0GM03_SPHPU
MKLLLQLQSLRSSWSSRLFYRLFHKDDVARTLLNLSKFEAINRCEQEVPEYFNFASDVLDKWTQLEKDGERPSTPAFWWINGMGSEVKWSFEELGFLSKKVANILSGPCGLQRVDRVVLILPRIPEWWLVNVACMRTGIVFLTGTTQLTAKDILYRLQASKAKGIITTDSLAPVVDSVASHCQSLKTKVILSEGRRDGWLNFKELFEYSGTKSQEPMTVFFTSGTTGSPKMAEHSHCSFGLGFAICGRDWLDLTPSDVMWNISDTGWVKAAIGCIFAPWLRGTCTFIHGMPQFEPKAILNTLSEYPVTTMCCAPTAYRMLVQHDLTSYKFKSLRHCLTGGEPLNPEVMFQWKNQTGLDIYEGYGQTEVVGLIKSTDGHSKAVVIPGSCPPKGKSVGSLGWRSGGRTENPHFNLLPSSPQPLGNNTLRAGDNPEKTAATQRGNFYITGDRGLMDEDGYLWFVGRSDDVIISSGYRIGPFEVESALIEHPAVVESAVVSSPDPIRGEVVKAFVVLSPSFVSHDPEKLTLELQQHVKKLTAPYKYPRKMEFVQQLPKTVTGKIRRNELRKKEWGRD